MNRIFRRSYIIYVFALAFLFGLIILFFTMGVNSDDWVVKEYLQTDTLPSIYCLWNGLENLNFNIFVII